jgi:hypothetical protein
VSHIARAVPDTRALPIGSDSLPEHTGDPLPVGDRCVPDPKSPQLSAGERGLSADAVLSAADAGVPGSDAGVPDRDSGVPVPDCRMSVRHRLKQACDTIRQAPRAWRIRISPDHGIAACAPPAPPLTAHRTCGRM